MKTTFAFLLALGVAVVLLAPLSAGPVDYETRATVRVYSGVQYQQSTCAAAAAGTCAVSSRRPQAANCAVSQRAHRNFLAPGTCNDPVSAFFQAIFSAGAEGDDDADDDSDD